MGLPDQDTVLTPTVVSPTRQWIFGRTARIDREEIIDTTQPSRADLAGTYRDIARINRFLGGTRAVLSALAPLIEETAAAKSTVTSPICILDIGTGSGDIPRAISRAASRGRFPGAQHRAVMLRATDINPKVVALARRQTARNDYPGIDIEEADALCLPYPDGAFDIALCSQTLHHFRQEECVRILREMARVTTTGFIVNDLIRSRIAAVGIRLWTHATFANRLTRHDAPISVMRAYTLAEYREMAQAAGLKDVVVRRVPLYRALLIHRKRN